MLCTGGDRESSGGVRGRCSFGVGKKRSKISKKYGRRKGGVYHHSPTDSFSKGIMKAGKGKPTNQKKGGGFFVFSPKKPKGSLVPNRLGLGKDDGSKNCFRTVAAGRGGRLGGEKVVSVSSCFRGSFVN